MAGLLKSVNTDKTIKCVLVHGGLFYNAGNNLSVLTDNAGEGKEAMRREGEKGMSQMSDCLKAVQKCEKPIVGVVRGGCHGIGFTTCALFDFIYVTEDANFKTPFMQSF